MISMDTEILYINRSFDPNDVEESCMRLIRELSSEWKTAGREHVKFTPFTEGITNTLIKVTRRQPRSSSSDADGNSVLVRAYGSGTDTMIDRAKELRIHQHLAVKALASPVLATFKKWIYVRFHPGASLRGEGLSRRRDFEGDSEEARRMAWKSSYLDSGI